MEKTLFAVGEKVYCNNNLPMPGNSIAPPLIVGNLYRIRDIIIDSKGNQHLDVGFASECNFIRSFETKEELKNGDITWWCHPSRFLPIRHVDIN